MRCRTVLLLALALAVGRSSVGADHQIRGEGSSVGAGLSARPPVEREGRIAQDTSLSLTEMLSGGSTEGYARATEPREFRFPEDHGAHEEFRTEWWYFTGNLTTAGGRRFGYQFTLFRSAVTPEMPPRESDWATRQVYMAHFAVTDPVNEAFHAHERFSRGAAGLAGVQTQPFRAWLEDWADPRW